MSCDPIQAYLAVSKATTIDNINFCIRITHIMFFYHELYLYTKQFICANQMIIHGEAEEKYDMYTT